MNADGRKTGWGPVVGFFIMALAALVLLFGGYESGLKDGRAEHCSAVTR